MPLYDYACRSCGNSFEIRQSYQEDPLTQCPKCHGEIRRVINQVGLVFKGGGYYITDSRPAGTATNPASGSEGADGGAGEGSKGPEGGGKDGGKDKADGGGATETAATPTPATDAATPKPGAGAAGDGPKAAHGPSGEKQKPAAARPISKSGGGSGSGSSA